MNLYDILLARCICGNKSEESIVATPLEVTENGEYEAEEGYAYNPVTVNVSGGGGIPAPKVTVTWKLSGVQPSDIGIIEFFGLVEESNGEYVGVRVIDIDTDEGNVSGICYPALFENDYKLFWNVHVSVGSQGAELNVTYSDFINCEEDDGGGIIITDTSSPAAFTATISNS